MNVQNTINEIRSLSVTERLKVVAAAWDSIADEAVPVSLSPEQRQELNCRSDAHEASPEDVLTGDQVLERLRGRL